MTQPTKQHETSKPIPIPQRGISGVPGILLHILLCLTSAMIPLGVADAFDATRLPHLAVEIISVVILLLVGVYFFRTGKLAGKASRGMLPILIFGGLLLIYMTLSAVPAALCFSLIFAIGEGAVLLATAPKKTLATLPLIPLLSFGLSAVACAGIDISLLCLLPLPATIALALGTRSSASKETGLTRVGVICLTSLCLGITAIGFGAWFLHKSLGSLDISVIKDFLDALREELIAQIMALHIDTGKEIVYPFEGQETLITNVVAVTFNILPAVFVVICNVAAALSQMVTLSGLTAFGFGESITDHVKAYRISVVSAFVFLASWVVALIANAETSTMVGTVAENFAIILLPGMALAGFLRLVQFMARKGCAPGCLIFLLFFIPCLSVNAIFILAGFEGIASVFGPLIAKLKPPKDDDNIFPPSQDQGHDGSGDSDNSDNNNNNDTNDNGPRLF